MNKSREAFEKWWLEKRQFLTFESECHEIATRRQYKSTWLSAWRAAKAEPDAATVALHFGYEVTKIRDQVFVAKTNQHFKVWTPFSRESHVELFKEYDRCS